MNQFSISFQLSDIESILSQLSVIRYRLCFSVSFQLSDTDSIFSQLIVIKYRFSFQFQHSFISLKINFLNQFQATQYLLRKLLALFVVFYYVYIFSLCQSCPPLRGLSTRLSGYPLVVLSPFDLPRHMAGIECIGNEVRVTIQLQ